MNRGVLLFAFNNGVIDYYKMAVLTAIRVNKFLKLPVSVVTDIKSVTSDYVFDNIIYTNADASNYRAKDIWINKGRYQAFDMTPYDETILLDTDYLINSDKLLKLFELQSDFVCHKDVRFAFEKESIESFGKYSPPLLWATVIRFNKTERVNTIFNLMQMVQKNYEHYSQVYDFQPAIFRNDYALSIALHIVNGHVENEEDYIPWKLFHCGKKDIIFKNDDESFSIKNYSDKATFITCKDCDIHMLGKTNFLEIA
jgi:hypothetical protein